MRETCWHSQCALTEHGTHDRIHVTAEGKTFRAPLDDPAPIDWPARFRAAAEVARGFGWGMFPDALDRLARKGAPEEVEAIGRALTGETK